MVLLFIGKQAVSEFEEIYMCIHSSKLAVVTTGVT